MNEPLVQATVPSPRDEIRPGPLTVTPQQCARYDGADDTDDDVDDIVFSQVVVLNIYSFFLFTNMRQM